jgi:hypothetical protein
VLSIAFLAWNNFMILDINRTGIGETPTILVNGYKLPDIHNLEDLKYAFE